MLINDILSRPDDCKALIDAYAARAVCVANTFRCKIPHKKAFFSVLTDDRFAGLFDAAERAWRGARAVDAARRRGDDAPWRRGHRPRCSTSARTARRW